MIKIQNQNPPMLGAPDTEGWLNCPNCGIRFKLTDKSRWRKRRHTTCGQLITFENSRDKTNPVWCVVSNIDQDNALDEDHQIHKWTKLFSSGTKVYCYPPYGNDDSEKIKILTWHRGSKQFFTMIVCDKWLVNCRATLVYDPLIVNELDDFWDGSEKSKQLAEKLAHLVNERNAINKKK